MNRFVIATVVVINLAGCNSADQVATASQSATPAMSAPTSTPTAAAPFPTTAFDDISQHPVSEALAAEFQAILDDKAGKGGVAATVMSPSGTWGGAVGKADSVRNVRINDQFAIASTTKSVIAAQVMQMVEAGELGLDDPATEHLPPDLGFDTNAATIRQLLGHQSGIPEYLAQLDPRLLRHRRRFWTPVEVLEVVPNRRAPAGEAFQYSNTDYQLLGLVIEQIRGRPVGEVLRDGVLDMDGVERLIYQPYEKPTEPMAMPGGQSTAALKTGGGYLPFLAAASADGPAAAMASDAPSLARWWRAFCAGEIVSQASVTEMTTLHDGYGLGLYDVADSYEQAVGHGGEHVDGSYVSWAGCVADEHAVVVVLSNRMIDISEVALALLDTASSD